MNYEKLKKVIEEEIHKLLDKEDACDEKLCKELDIKHHKVERLFNVEMLEENGNKFIAVYTDGRIYELLFQNYDNMDIPCESREKIEKAINKRMKFKDGEHYFELYGMGRLDYW